MSANTLPTTPAWAVPPVSPEGRPAASPERNKSTDPYPNPNTVERLFLSGIPWQTYVALSDLLSDHRIRMTFDRGNLEIMTLSINHERWTSLLGRLVEAVTEEMDIEVTSGGSVTFRREDVDRGVEPDKCYWIQQAAQMRGRQQIDFERDPPPDLAIETEVTRTIINRLAVYAALRYPEVWRFDGEQIRVLLLDAAGDYQDSTRSAALPFLPVPELVRFLSMMAEDNETKGIRAFRQWVRDQIGVNWGRPG